MSPNEGVAWQGSAPPIASGSGEWRANRLSPQGHVINKDWIDQMVDDGLVYGLQFGTEDAPIASTTGIDDALVEAVVDSVAGLVIIPLFAQVNISAVKTATLAQVMLEVDRSAARYSSGGTAYVPNNYRTDKSGTSSAAAYVGPDVTTSAKTALHSVEFFRKTFMEDAIATPTPGDFQTAEWSRRVLPSPVIVGAGSWLLHFGAATADVTGYGTMVWAEMTTAQYENS